MENMLEKMTEDERALIISLPYRAGLWVSLSDDTGGDEAADKELTALANIIAGFSSQVFGSELLQYVMNETLKYKDRWPEWSKKLEAFPSECENALDILYQYVDDKDVTAFSQRLMEIGEAVAVAFREYEDETFVNQLRIYGSYIMSRLRAKFTKEPERSFDQYLSISISERKALTTMANSLKIRYVI